MTLPETPPIWEPKKEMYKRDPRAAQIREVSLQIVRLLDELVRSPNIIENPGRQAELYANLELLNGRLIELGIYSKMHVGQPTEFFASNIVASAEFVAGNIIKETGRALPNTSEQQAIFEDLDELRATNAFLGSAKLLPEKSIDFLVVNSIINMGYGLLDADESEQFNDK